MANVRLRFANGYVANLAASRVSPERMRKSASSAAQPIPATSRSITACRKDSSTASPATRSEESSLLKKVLAVKLGIGKDSTVVSEFAGKKIHRENHADRKGQTAQARTAKLRPMRPRKNEPRSSAANPPNAPWTWPSRITRQIQHTK